MYEYTDFQIDPLFHSQSLTHACMASTKDRPIFETAIQEHGCEGEDIDTDANYHVDNGFLLSGCLCFKWCRRGSDGHRHCVLSKDNEVVESESWVVSRLRKARELNEVGARPKWKNPVRKIGGYWRSSKWKRDKNGTRFGYDAESYALNFDGGIDGEEEDGLLMSHSTGLVGTFRNDERRQVECQIGWS